jgi:O-antigen/teichoic acid export membrane protein
MSKEKTLLKNTIIYSIGNFGSKILSFVLLPFYTYYLSTNDYGYFDLITTTVMLLTPIITFQIFDGLYRYLLDSKNDDEFSNIISNSFFIVIRNLIIFIIVYVIFVQFKSFRYQYLILSQLGLGILTSFCLQISRGIKRNIEYSISGILSTIIVLASNIIFITVMNLRVGSLIMSNILAYVVVIIYLEWKLKLHKYLKIKLNNKAIKKQLVLYSIPLIPNLISWWFMNVSDRYFLALYKGIEANGIYAISNKFPSILIMLNSIFSLAWQESAITEYNSKDRNKFYTKMFNVLISIEFTSVIILLAFTKFIMTFMVNNKFSSAWLYVPFLYMGTIFNSFSSFYGTGYMSSKDTIGAFSTSVFGGIINVIINVISIPIIGIQGAAFSTMISFLVMWVARLLQTRKYFKIDIDLKKFILLSSLSILFIVFYYINNNILEVIMMILSIIITFIFNKDLINKVMKFMVKKIRTSILQV